MKPLTLLKRVRRLLAKPERWIKALDALTRRGEYSWPACRDAYKFCVLGAFVHVTKANDDDDYAALLGFDDATHAASWNDAPRRTHAQVLARLDKAIARLEKP